MHIQFSMNLGHTLEAYASTLEMYTLFRYIVLVVLTDTHLYQAHPMHQHLSCSLIHPTIKLNKYYLLESQSKSVYFYFVYPISGDHRLSLFFLLISGNHSLLLLCQSLLLVIILYLYFVYSGF